LVGAPEVEVSLYTGLAELPHFNPDLDGDGAELPLAVRVLRHEVGRSDGLLISSPEYAHGAPGCLKNALDWLVSGPEIVHKPIGLLNASQRSTHAQASLAETLRTMSTRLVEQACVTFPLSGRSLDAAAIVKDPDLSAQLLSVLAAMVSAVPAYREYRVAMLSG
jgi:NAD(P)H-dependent FMN reductase